MLSEGGASKGVLRQSKHPSLTSMPLIGKYSC